MPKNPLVGHPPWRQLLIVSLVAPAVIVLAVMAFVWPAARTQPRALPVGLVGTGAVAEKIAQNLGHGAFDLGAYSDDADARTAIEDREVDGAFEVAPGNFTVLTATAASPAVAQLLTALAQQMTAGTQPVTAIDVAPTARTDARSAVFTSMMSPLVLGGEILAVIVAVLIGFRPARRQLLALFAVSGVTGLGIYLVVQGYLGALPGNRLSDWGALSLTLFALSATTAGLATLVGPAGVAVGAALMVFVGNPFSGISSAPELLPTAVARLGQLMPPGAGSNLLRSTAYFGGHGAAIHVVVLAAWSVFGIVAVIEGHRRAARRHAARHRTDLFAASRLHEALVHDSHLAESHLADSHLADSRPADSRLADSQPADSRPADSHLAGDVPDAARP
jgi:hypothetical protein